MDNCIDIVIADDHPIFLDGLRHIIESSDYKVAAEAKNGRDAVELIEKHKPRVAVLDIEMPYLDGLEILAAGRKKFDGTKIILLTAHKNEKIFNRAMDLGAYGYILKENASSELIDCIKAVLLGDYFVSPAISSLLIGRNRKRNELEEKHPGICNLSKVEKQVLKMIAESKSSREIGDELFVSSRTVEKHRENISRKLDIHGSNALLKFALDNRSSI